MNGRKIAERAMDAKVIEPMNIISEFKYELLKGAESSIHNKIRFKDIVGCFRDSIIIRAAFMTKRTINFYKNATMLLRR